MMHRSQLIGAGTALAACLAVTAPAQASNAKLKSIAKRDVVFVRSDVKRVVAAEQGTSYSALKTADHELGLGLSQYIKDVTNTGSSSTAGANAKHELLGGLRSMRHGVKTLSAAVTYGLSGKKTQAKAAAERAVKEIDTGGAAVDRASATIEKF